MIVYPLVAAWKKLTDTSLDAPAEYQHFSRNISFRDLFSMISWIGRSFGKFVDLFGHVRTCLDLFPLLTHSDTFRCIRMHAEAFDWFQDSSKTFEKKQRNLDDFGCSEEAD